MRRIKLTQNKFALVDDEDFDYLNQWKWYVAKYKNTFYARRVIYPNGATGKRIYFFMHRQIIYIPNGQIIDHKDHNGLNNQKSNLRLCSIAQNNLNKTSHKGSSSKYLGVSWDKQRNKWVVRIMHNGKYHSGGGFNIEQLAAYRYNELAQRFHGEFAHLNII